MSKEYGRLLRSLSNEMVIVGLSLAALLIQIVPSPAYLRIALVLPLVGSVPGLAVVRALFPASGSLRMPVRGVLAVLLSLCIVPAVATLLDRTPWGIRSLSMILSLTVLSLCGTLVGRWREQRLERSGGDIAGSGQRSRAEPPRINAKVGWAASILFLAVVATGVYWTLLAPSFSKPFTEFYTEPEVALLLSEASRGSIEEPALLPIVIVNRENQEHAYTVHIVVDGVSEHVLGPIQIEDGERWLGTVPIFRGVNPDHRLELHLFREGDLAPYRTLHLWIG
jgi:uncharacterized membrane protein